VLNNNNQSIPFAELLENYTTIINSEMDSGRGVACADPRP